MEELEDFSENRDETGPTLHAFVTGRDVIAVIADGSRKDTAARVTEEITGSVQETMVDEIQVEYRSVKKGIKKRVFQLVQEVLTDVVEQRRLDTLLVRNADKLARPDRIMDVLSQCIVGSDDLIKMVAQFMERHMDKVNNEFRLECILERYEKTGRMVFAKNENEIPTLLKCSPSESKFSGKRELRCKCEVVAIRNAS